MLNGQLIKLLTDYPPEIEVHMEVNGRTGFPTDVDWLSGGSKQWIVITDYPISIKERENENG